MSLILVTTKINQIYVKTSYRIHQSEPNMQVFAKEKKKSKPSHTSKISHYTEKY